MHIAILTRLPRYYSEQRLHEEAAQRGHKVSLIEYPKCHIHIGSDAPQVWYEQRPLDSIDAIIPRLAFGSVAYGAAIARQLEVFGAYTTASSIAMGRTFDRLRSLQVLSRSGLTIPQTVFSREGSQIEDLFRLFTLPVIISPAVTTQGSGPVLAESAKAATGLMRALNNNAGFMVQEHFGDDSIKITAMVIGTTVVASVYQAPVTKDDAKKALPVKLTLAENKVILKAAKALGVSVCSVQLIRSAKGVYITAVDASPSLELFEHATERKIAGKIIDYIEQNAKRRNKKDRVGA